MWEWQTESDGHGQIDSAIDPNQEYICFIFCLLLLSETSIPFYSTSNG